MIRRFLAMSLTAALLVSSNVLAAPEGTGLIRAAEPAASKTVSSSAGTVKNTEGPVLSKTSSTTSAAKAYAYYPFNPNNTGEYINEFYCETTRLMIVADDGKAYLVTDPTPFTDGSFTCTLRYSSNANMIRSFKVADASKRNSKMPAYALRLSDNAILDDITCSFSTTFKAPKELAIKVRDASNSSAKPVDMTVKTGASIVIEHTITVSYDRLNRLQFTPKYNVEHDSLNRNHPAGIESDVMYPETDFKNSDADYVWTSIGDICAEVNTGDSTLEYVPKLSAFWRDANLLKMFSKTDAYIRDFGDVDVTGRVQLLLTNPFLTFDREEVIPHEDVVIYEYKDKRLKDVTKNFSYTTNSDGEPAFQIYTNHLGTYIFSKEKVS